MASLLQKCLGTFPPGGSEMINCPHALIIWGWVYISTMQPGCHSACKKNPAQLKPWDQSSVSDETWNKLQNNEPLGFPERGFGRCEKANSLTREFPCCASFAAAGVTYIGTSTIPVLLETFLTTFFPRTQVGKHGADCSLPTDVLTFGGASV